MIARVFQVLLVVSAALTAAHAHAQTGPQAPSAQAAPAPEGHEEPDEEPMEPARPGARIELSLLSAPLGAAAGMFVCVAAYCDSGRAAAGLALGGASLGVLAAALTTRFHPIPYAMAQAIEGGAVWGAFTSVAANLLASDLDPRVLYGSLAAGELLGAGVGALVARASRPTSGAVALANSGAVWLSSTTTLLAFAIDPYLDGDHGRRALGGGLLAAELIGLGAGGVLGQRLGTTRVQALLSDVGATFLGGAFPLLAWLIGGNAVGDREIFGSAAAGVVLGFAGAYLLTEWVPRRKQAAIERAAQRLNGVQLTMMPLRQGGGISLSKRL